MRAEPMPIENAAELEHARALEKRLRQVILYTRRFDEADQRGVQPGSALARDDRSTAWLNSSHALNAVLQMAVENARALERLLYIDGVLSVPTQAHYPLLRSVLEASALAKWILEPDDHVERVTRSLRLRITDLKEDEMLAKRQAEAIGGFAVSGALLARDEFLRHEAERRDTQRAKVQEIADAQDIAWSAISVGLPGWGRLIREVCAVAAGEDYTAIPGAYAESVWRVISGLSHPSPSRIARNSHVERLSASAAGKLSVRITASLDWTSQAMLVAAHTFVQAIELYRDRAQASEPSAFFRGRASPDRRRH